MIGIGLGIPFANQKSKVILFDSFNRADSANLGIADTKQTWQGSNFGIVNNKAYQNAGDTVESLAYISNVISDLEISADITFNKNLGIVFRYLDSNNYWLARFGNGSNTNVELYKKIGGSYTLVGSLTGLVVGQTYNLKVITIGSSISVYLNNTQVITVNDSTLISNNGVGIRTNRIGDYLDNFCVKAV